MSILYSQFCIAQYTTMYIHDENVSILNYAFLTNRCGLNLSVGQNILESNMYTVSGAYYKGEMKFKIKL